MEILKAKGLKRYYGSGENIVKAVEALISKFMQRINIIKIDL